MKHCITEEQLVTLLAGGIPEDSLEPVLHHLHGCVNCRSRFDELSQECSSDMRTALPRAYGAFSIRRILRRVGQATLRLAYRLATAYWFLRRPATCGVLCAIWHNDELLLIRTSYKSGYSLPGGGLKRGESKEDALHREVMEEVAIDLAGQKVTFAAECYSEQESKRDTVWFYEVEFDCRPVPRPDGLEIMSAHYVSRDRLRDLPLQPQVRAFVNQLAR